LDKLHSYAEVYLDGTLVGSVDRRLNQDSIVLSVPKPGARLDILVENTGRVNFGPAIPGERAGITKQVTLNGTPLTGWDIYPLPMKNVEKLHYSAARCEGPCFYRGSFDLAKTDDTFLDTSEFTKGELWLNGRALGRIWNIGPQRTLYAPAPWLKKGRNEIVVFDVRGKSGGSVRGLDRSILDGPVAAFAPQQ